MEIQSTNELDVPMTPSVDQDSSEKLATTTTNSQVMPNLPATKPKPLMVFGVN